MAINALDEIWQLGCPLSEAPWHFASVDLRKRYQLPKASRKLSPKSGLGMLGNVKDRPEAANLARIALRIQRLSDRSFARSEIIDQMRASVIDRLQRGKLVALGFRKGTGNEEPPLQIHVRFLKSRNVKWSSDEIISGPYELISVRIVSCRKIKSNNFSSQESNNSLPEKAIGKPKPGRPPVGPVLRSIVRKLKKAGQFEGKIQKQQIALVRDRAQKAHPALFPTPKRPSDAKIIEALKAEGLTPTY